MTLRACGANFENTIRALPAFAKVGFPGIVALIAFLVVRYRALGPKALYAKWVSATLHYRWATLSAACVLLFVGNHIYGKVEQQPFRYQPSRAVRLTVEMPRNYDVDKAREIFRIAEDILIARKDELDIEAIGSRYSGRRGTRLTLYLTPADEGKLTTDEVQRRAMALLPKDIPGVRFKSGGGRGSSAVGAGVQLKGRSQEILAILAEDIETGMQGMPGVHEIQTSLESGTEEIRVSVNRERAQRYGLSPRAIATTIAFGLGVARRVELQNPGWGDRHHRALARRRPRHARATQNNGI